MAKARPSFCLSVKNQNVMLKGPKVAEKDGLPYLDQSE